ncbi:MAG: PIN domain-containing protein [Acidobacteria bacterium]|nr:PIN domain-containing protein [Acidobacteriota bacterium]
MTAIDTNILIYAHDPRDPVKQAIALSLLDSLEDVVLLWQVACEFLSASRKLEPFGYPQAQAWQEIRKLQRAWTTIIPSWSVIDKTESLLSNYSLSFWDAMIIAACLEGGVARLYSEDFDAYSRVGALEIVNPFKIP